MGLLFALFLAAMVVVVLGIAAHHLPRQTVAGITAGLTIWLAYSGTLGFLGVVANPDLRPPGPALLLIPVFLFVAFYLVRADGALRVATGIPIGWLMGLQAFRVIVELFLHQLWKNGLAPRMLTYEGSNFDIAIGLSAPLVAWLYARGAMREQVALLWNFLGLAMLANVAVRALLTAPGPFQLITSDVPNLAIGTFPFTYIPGFMAPLALVLHVLSIRALRARMRSARHATPSGQRDASPQAK